MRGDLIYGAVILLSVLVILLGSILLYQFLPTDDSPSQMTQSNCEIPSQYKEQGEAKVTEKEGFLVETDTMQVYCQNGRLHYESLNKSRSDEREEEKSSEVDPVVQRHEVQQQKSNRYWKKCKSAVRATVSVSRLAFKKKDSGKGACVYTTDEHWCIKGEVKGLHQGHRPNWGSNKTRRFWCELRDGEMYRGEIQTDYGMENLTWN